LPASAQQDSPAGAEAFARFWLTTLDYGYATGDTAVFLAAGRCAGCVDLADGIEKIYAEGGSIQGGQLKVLDTRVDRHVIGKAAAVELYYSRAQRVVVDGKGQRFVDRAAPRLGLFVVLTRANGRWQVDRFPVID